MDGEIDVGGEGVEGYGGDFGAGEAVGDAHVGF